MIFTNGGRIRVEKMIPALLLGIFLFVDISIAQHHHNQSPLSAPGHDIFGAIQETISALEGDPNTDWTKVNIEALRRHLLDMKAITEQVGLVDTRDIENGVMLMVRPETDKAQKALKRVFSMHPQMLKKEKGWKMKTQFEEGQWTIRCTSADQKDVDKIRALGYIGLLVTGSHHQQHHWKIATGQMSYPN